MFFIQDSCHESSRRSRLPVSLFLLLTVPVFNAPLLPIQRIHDPREVVAETQTFDFVADVERRKSLLKKEKEQEQE